MAQSGCIWLIVKVQVGQGVVSLLQGSLQGGGERPLRFRVPPISTKLISSVEHWNTST